MELGRWGVGGGNTHNTCETSQKDSLSSLCGPVLWTDKDIWYSARAQSSLCKRMTCLNVSTA